MPSVSCQKCHQNVALPASTTSASGGLAASAWGIISSADRQLHALAAGDSDDAASSSHPNLSAPLTHKLLLQSALKDILAAPRLNHPLCKECTDLLVRIMKEETEEIRSERDALNRFVKEMSEHQDRKEGDEEEDEMYAGQSIEELERQSKLATDELRAADAERVQVEEEIAALDREEAELEAEEEAFWAQHSNLLLELSAVSAQRDSLRTSISLDAAQLSRLQQTNPYNDAFSIGHSGGFATINGLRLGKLPNAHVDWKEINAAWGQTALLLDVLARKVGVQFTDYHLVPKGSFSTVKKASGDEAVYELYGTGDWQIGRLLAPQSRRFDHAMVAFLELLRQLAAAACASDPELRLPHAISKDRIGEASIRLHFGSEETWTRALRHVLLTLKVLLSWACRRTDD